MEVIVISNTVQKFNGESFYLCGAYFQHKGKRLHREVWRYHNGEIPKGFHVHHKDGNRCNNNPDNLVLIESGAHMSLHMQEQSRKEKSRACIIKAIESAPAWHGSEQGKEWHSFHGKESWAKRMENKYVCSYCGKEFFTKSIYGKNRNTFCGNNCKSAYRRASGVDNEERTCPVCNKVFIANRYAKKITCGYECALKRRRGK